MRRGRMPLLAAALAIGMGGGAGAAPVLGSHVGSGVFERALGAVTGWTYLGDGSGLAPFTEPGMATLVLRDSAYPDTFGMIGPAGREVVFAVEARPGAEAAIAPWGGSFRFFFRAADVGVDSNIRFTDGSGRGWGAAQAGIDIFFNAERSTWAFFYDDGGGSGRWGDDNDHDDLVVTYRPATAVSEPAALALLAVGLAGLGIVVARRRAGSA